ncbi:Alpha/Beta hydrolase protein [Chaetomium strumarium]|uniref:Alpha/Beta hydrolase protein n=1 Tax=Chaetomium strumarium TaxID=1170767 RepID=A0AAJ0GM08_9PEZI|nr:Alpha/Beta hydrolase protein [Chaetomium strumarium]
MHLVGVALAALASLGASESLRRLDTSLTILSNNDLQASASTEVVIVTDAKLYKDAPDVCAKLGEQLWRPAAARGPAFAEYLQYEGRANASSSFWAAASAGVNAVDMAGRRHRGPAHARFPGLCTNSAPFSTQSSQDTSARWQISVDVNNQTLTGFRDRLSFRFLGIRYAAQPQRFTYSTLFRGSGEAASALEYGSQCAQGTDTGTEDCLFLNVWTPYLPNPNSAAPPKGTLRPVAFWIHGGAFTGGTANDATFDGGNMASRGDMVVVAINYRLSTLGFLALRDGKTNGNFGLADQITALEWVREHIHALGGDKNRITVFGQSAGAASVRALLASPKAEGKFAGAIMLSNLGGINYGTTYSRYYTIDEQVAVAADAILAATNCTQDQVDCLRALPPHALTGLANPARFLVVDGTYLTTPELRLTGGGGGPPSNVSLMMGITRDDGAPFIGYPSSNNDTTSLNQSAYLASHGFPSLPPTTLDKLFPVLPTTGNATLDLFTSAARVATDGIFRCIDQATVYSSIQSGGGRFPSVYYYEFNRTYQPAGWPDLDVCSPAYNKKTSKTHPHGDPVHTPYLRCHSGELYYVFGNLARQGLPVRDEGDLPFEQFVLDSFVSFMRSGGDPNPDLGWLRARGYGNTLRLVVEGNVDGEGRWKPSTRGRGRVRVLDWPRSVTVRGFTEGEQCRALGLPLDYYERAR